MKKYIIIAAVALLLVAAGIFYFKSRKPAVSYKTAKLEKGTIVAMVSATGNLSAVTTILVGTQVSGTIQKLYVDYNSRVRKGETIAEIDPALFNAAVEQAQGNALAAEANLLKAKVALADAERTLQRNKKLLADGIISQGDFDLAETAWQSAKASIRAAEGSVAQTRGALMQAQTNLRNSIIRSPVDGVVISRAIDVGQTVAASFQTPTLFTIAQDLTKMQIEVSVDEADISRIKIGQQATFSVDAYPEQKFSGRVVQIRSAPVVNQNVVTYVVVVNVDNSEMKLKPGMTANVSIVVAEKEDVVKIPPAALRFKPKGGEEKGAAKGESAPAAPSMGKGGREGGGKPGEKKTGGGQIVYTLKEGKPVPLSIKTGIANSSGVELLEGALQEGDEVIVEQTGGESKKKSGTSPMGRPF